MWDVEKHRGIWYSSNFPSISYRKWTRFCSGRKKATKWKGRWRKKIKFRLETFTMRKKKKPRINTVHLNYTNVEISIWLYHLLKKIQTCKGFAMVSFGQIISSKNPTSFNLITRMRLIKHFTSRCKTRLRFRSEQKVFQHRRSYL